MDLVAQVLTYVRTEEGVVELQPGDPAPDNALDKDVERLTAAGALAEPDQAAAAAKVEDILAEVGDDPEAAAAALEVERAGKNRKTLVEQLEKIVASSNSDGAGQG